MSATESNSTEESIVTEDQIPTADDAAPETGSAADASPVEETTDEAEPRPAKAPKRRAPSPAAIAARTSHAVLVPVLVEIDPKTLKSASKHAVVENGVVFLVDGENRHEIGLAQGDEPLVPYVRRYLDHLASLERLLGKIQTPEVTVRDIDAGLGEAEAVLAHPDFVGDPSAFRKRLAAVSKQASAVRDNLNREREEARAAAVAQREDLVARAEAIAAKPVEEIHWKDDTATLRTLLDEWKAAQREGVRIGKDVEKTLWERFAHARSAFERTRKHHFADLDRSNAKVADVKEALVVRAEALATSTRWEETARELRDLMSQWKSAGRGRKASDDALWARFQVAQDAFFEARRGVLDAERSSEEANLESKEALVAEAESLLPIKDVAAARAAMRSIHDRFDAIGRVPKPAVAILTKRLHAVERAIREADEAAWTSRNPEVEARVSETASKLMAAIAEIDADLAKATDAGDSDLVSELTEARNARQAWLDQIRGSA